MPKYISRKIVTFKVNVSLFFFTKESSVKIDLYLYAQLNIYHAFDFTVYLVYITIIFLRKIALTCNSFSCYKPYLNKKNKKHFYLI